MRKRLVSNNEYKTWISADFHLGHANIIKYCHRPFIQAGDLDSNGNWVSKSIAYQRANEMNEALFFNHNSLVKNNDVIIHIGDFAFDANILYYLKRLNGKFKFILGNHDERLKSFLYGLRYNSDPWLHQKVELYEPEEEIYINDKLIILSHYSMRVWNESHRGSWHLYGHSHGTLKDDPNSLSMDVGIDCNNYFPFSFSQIEDKMSKKTFVPIDHHKNK